jgi:hypothetical protein
MTRTIPKPETQDYLRERNSLPMALKLQRQNFIWPSLVCTRSLTSQFVLMSNRVKFQITFDNLFIGIIGIGQDSNFRPKE